MLFEPVNSQSWMMADVQSSLYVCLSGIWVTGNETLAGDVRNNAMAERDASQTPSANSWKLWTAGIVLTGAVLRFWHLGYHALWLDEAATLARHQQ